MFGECWANVGRMFGECWANVGRMLRVSSGNGVPMPDSAKVSRGEQRKQKTAHPFRRIPKPFIGVSEQVSSKYGVYHLIGESWDKRTLTCSSHSVAWMGPQVLLTCSHWPKVNVLMDLPAFGAAHPLLTPSDAYRRFTESSPKRGYFYTEHKPKVNKYPFRPCPQQRTLPVLQIGHSLNRGHFRPMEMLAR